MIMMSFLVSLLRELSKWAFWHFYIYGLSLQFVIQINVSPNQSSINNSVQIYK